MEDTQYIISPRPPVRGFMIAAVLCVIGAGVMAAAIFLDWHQAAGIAGGVVLVLGLLLFILGFIAMRMGRSSLLFTKSGYELDGPGGKQAGKWKTVTRVSQAGHRITIHNRNGKRTQLVFSPGAEAQFEEMRSDLVARLDKAKGYKNM